MMSQEPSDDGMHTVFVCAECGKITDPSPGFCAHCGSVNGRAVQPGAQPDGSPAPVFDDSTAKKAMFATMLALLPGLFDVFGLGHIAMGKYVKAALFLVCTALLMFFRFIHPLEGYSAYLDYASLGIFILQAVDVYLIVNRALGLRR